MYLELVWLRSLTWYLFMKAVQMVLILADLPARILFGYSFIHGSSRKRKLWQQSGGKEGMDSFCVHQSRILLRGRLHDWQDCQVDQNFVLLHKAWADAHCLQSDSVSLMGFANNCAFFAKVPQDAADIFNSRHGPFLYSAQFEKATEIWTVSYQNFLTIAAKMPETGAKLVLLCCTGRCGSTLLTQTLEQVPRTVCMSEPDFMQQSMKKFVKKMPEWVQKKQSELIVAGFKFMCKKQRSRPVDYFVLKPRSYLITLIPLFKHHFPHMTFVFMYRELMENYRSHSRLHKPKMFLSTTKLLWEHNLRKLYHDYFTFYDPKNMEVREELFRSMERRFDIIRHIAIFHSLHILSYLECKEKFGVNFHCVSYNDLKSRPREELEKLLRHCQMPTEEILSKDKVLPPTDSQTKSFISRDRLKGSGLSEVSEVEVQKIEEIFRICSLPNVDSYVGLFQNNKSTNTLPVFSITNEIRAQTEAFEKSI